MLLRINKRDSLTKCRPASNTIRKFKGVTGSLFDQGDPVTNSHLEEGQLSNNQTLFFWETLIMMIN